MSRPKPIRRDGWTAERQLRFLDALASTRSVKAAAASVGLSRESAYRLRNRSDGLFALLWDRAFADEPSAGQVHNLRPAEGRLMRLLGNHYRRVPGIFRASAFARPPP
jgi:hypothetical protein